MKVLLSWLREMAPLEQSPAVIGDTLSDLGTPVESMRRVGEGLDGAVVAEVLDLRPHPDADRIQLVDVDAGDGDALQICCGAFNMAVGDKVPLATLGTTMPSGMVIERRKLRGEWSNGMLCSAAELGLSADHEGILILGGDPAAGTPLAEALGVRADVLYDLEVNPNRPDAMSVAGLARDLAARLGVPFALPAPAAVPTRAGGPAPGVEIVDAQGCGRFTADVLSGVQVGSSPAWLANRLTLLGMRPINTLVDISNYVMLELGQPNHPYDRATVAGDGFRIRRAAHGEQLVTLDDVTRTFTADDLLICDATDVPIGIAGVMGGAACEIGPSTTEVLVELAWFDPLSVAKTSRRLNLRSEASSRFEKGCDPEVLELAAARFAELAHDLAGAERGGELVDRRGELPARPRVRVRTPRVNQILGTDLDRRAIAGCLDPIGFVTTAVDGDADPSPGGGDLEVAIPSWRLDSSTEIDVIEEVARLHGYGNIPRSVPPATRTGRLDERQQARRRLRSALVGLGLSEAMPLPFLAPGQLARAGLADEGITLTNPLVAEESVLRTSLLPGLLASLAYNASHRNLGVGLYELGHVFNRPPVGQPLPDEQEHLAVALGDRDATDAVQTWWVLAETLAVPDVELVAAERPGLHPTRSAAVVVGGVDVGSVGEVDPGVRAAHELQGPVGWLEVSLDRLLALPHGDRPYRKVSRFPSSDVDLAFELDEGTPAAALERTLARAAGELLSRLELIDVFRGDPVPAGRRSLAYRLRLQATDRTLTAEDVAEVRRRCIDAAEASLPATLRG